MLRVALCDEDAQFVKQMKGYLEGILHVQAVNCQVEHFCSSKDFLKEKTYIRRFHILFIDINMKSAEGLRTVERIRNYSKEIFIVFVTGFANYAVDGYRAQVDRYILKNDPRIKELLEESLGAIIGILHFATDKKLFQFVQEEREILIHRIFFIESHLHKVQFHLEGENKSYTMYRKLSELEKELEPFRFLRVHQSFLVNPGQIRSISNRELLMNSGDKITIPKSRYQSVRDLLMQCESKNYKNYKNYNEQREN